MRILNYAVHTCQHLKVRKRNTRYCEGAKRPSPRERSDRGGEGVGGGTVGSFCIFGLKIVQSGAYLERKFRLRMPLKINVGCLSLASEMNGSNIRLHVTLK